MQNKEEQLARVDYSMLVVPISKQVPLSPSRERWNKLTVVVSGKTGGTMFAAEGQEVNLSSFDFSPYLTDAEKNELPKLDTVALFFSLTDTSDLELLLMNAAMYSESLVFLSDASQAWINLTTRPSHELVTWLTAGNAELEPLWLDFAGKSKQAVMMDKEREGKVLYALFRLLSLPNGIYHTHQIINNSFSGLVRPGDAKQAQEANLSYWFNSRQQVFPDGLFIGGQQAFRVYYDLLISHRLREAVANYVQGGRLISETLGLQNAMNSVGAQFRRELNPDVTSFQVPLFNELSDAQKISGTVPITAVYEVLGEIRRVMITIKEAA